MFMANTSHELRTPMNAIIGHSGVILAGMTGELTPRQQKKLQSIYDSAKHLLDLINQVLDLEKVEMGQVVMEPEEFSLSGAIAEWESLLTERAKSKEIDFSIYKTGFIPDQITTDHAKLTQVVLNLGYNAIKFTQEGSVKITLGWDPATSELQVDVVDTGIGIAPHNLDVIFDEFWRLKNRQVNQEGTGLGLAIVKRLVRVLRGRISVESQLGQGTTFSVVVPVETVQELQPA
ncbi:MAG: ATP-binding protein [Chloroflexota bacterium]